MRLLARGRLTNCAENCLRAALTLVRSPAGYGKTTLLGQWYREHLSRGVTAVWVTLDEDEADPGNFLSTLAYAAGARGAIGAPFVQALRQGTPGMTGDIVLRSLMHEFERTRDPIVLYLDDYHLIESPQIDSLVSALLQRLPQNLHLVLASRAKPAFPVSALRAAGMLQEVTAEDLRFREEEIVAFLGDGVDREDIDLVAARSEGWPVALQLLHLWIRDQGNAHDLIESFSGTTEQMAAYMVDQVMRVLPGATRDFLIETSILDRINGDLANAVCERTDCWRILEDLERLNALIFPVDSSKVWYRHHHLFADFLRSQLSRRGEAELRKLHRRASDWFMSRDEVIEGLRHAHKARDTDGAMGLLEDRGLIYRMLRDGVDLYKKLKGLFPDRTLDLYPRLAAAQVLLLLKEGDVHAGRAQLDDIERKLAAGVYGSARPESDELRREILLMESFLSAYLDSPVSEDSVAAMEGYIGSVDPGDHWYRAVLNNLVCIMHYRRGHFTNAIATAHASLDHCVVSGTMYCQVFVNIHLGCFEMAQGSLTDALRHFERARSITEDTFPYDRNLRALRQIFLAEACYEQNRLDEAGEYTFGALPQIEEAEGWIEVYLSGYRVLLGLAHAKRRLKDARAALEAGRRFAARRGLLRLDWFLAMREVEHLTRSGECVEARRLLEEAGSTLRRLEARFEGGQLWHEHGDYLCTRAALELAEHMPAQAYANLGSLVEPSDRARSCRTTIRALLLSSLASRALGNLDQATHRLRRALELSRIDGYLRVYLDEGKLVEELFKAVIAHVGLAALSSDMVDHMVDILSAFSAGQEDPDKGLVANVLTGRERDVLQRLKSGGSNKRIARELDLTDNAVKFHLKNIYRKLGVNGRKLAVSVAVKRGLT